MSIGTEVDAILKQGRWGEWRAQRQGDPDSLWLAAAAWCSSSHWDGHTPNLEDWKMVVADLAFRAGAAPLPADRDGGLPFPAIPLFEDEQVKDWCAGLVEPSSAAELAERLEAEASLLAVEPGEGAALCWDSLPAGAKRGLSFFAFCWLLGGRGAALQNLPLPSEQEVCALLGMSGGRSADAVMRIELAAKHRRQQGFEAAPAERILETLAQWRNPAPAATAHIVGPSAPLAERLCSSLFGAAIDVSAWGEVAREAIARRAGSPDPHPLAAITKLLREHDHPPSLDEMAWARFRDVLESYPGILDADPSDPAGPLPALDLAACIRSMKTIGEVALGLLPMAGARRLQVSWWRALRAGLRAAPRRGGWCNANDRPGAAVRLLLLQARRMPGGEAQALEVAFAGEVTHAVR